MISKNKSISKKFRNINNSGVFVILLFLLISLSAWFIFNEFIPVLSDFEINLWRPAHLLLQGLSPYDSDMFEGLRPIWFPPIIGLFLPLGALPIQVASNIWFILQILSFFFIIVVSAHRFSVHSLILGISVIALGFFPSSVENFRLGQVSMMVCLALLIISRDYQRMKPSIIGLLLALSFVKPQTIVIFIPIFFLVLWKNGLGKLIRVITFTIAWFLVFCVPLFVLYPNWIPDFYHNLINNPSWAYPTLYPLLKNFFSNESAAYVAAGLYLLLGIVIALIIFMRKCRLEALLWSMALTPVFSPVVWSWDFVLMYPLLLYRAYDRKSSKASNIVIIGYGFCLALYITMIQFGYSIEMYAVWVPLFLLIILIIGEWKNQIQDV